MFKNKNSVVFGCFSPPIMIATFIFEVCSVIYVLYRYKLSTELRIITALLINLSIFQLAEYFVCENSAIAEISSRVGFLAITLLPVLGLHLMSKISKYDIKKKIITLYILATLIGLYFLITPNSFQAYECTGNYVIFQIGQKTAWLYSIYYFGVIVATIAIGISQLSKTTKLVKRNILWLITGYAVFITPVAIVTVTHPDTRRAIPSILCGFAVFFAIVLVTKVSPKVLKKR